MVWEGDVTDVCHFDSVPADQCVRRKRMQAVKKTNQYFSRGAILHTRQYPRELLYMYGTKGCTIQYMALLLFILQYIAIIATSNMPTQLLACVFVVQYCTQMVQQT